MAYIRKFKTGSGATGVQVCRKEYGKVVETTHIGSARSEKQLKKLLKKARAVMEGNKPALFNLENFEKKE